MMNKKKFLHSIICVILFNRIHAQDSLENDFNGPLFQTRILKDEAEVRRILSTDYQAIDITFITNDNLMLEGIWIPRTDAQATLVVSSGFYPGLQHGMATLVPLLQKTPVNILFYNNRGKGKSQGSFFSSIFQSYGTNEHKDVIAAIEAAHNKAPNLPVIPFGLCAGALHTVNALNTLKIEKALDKYNIKAAILDSTIVSLTESSIPALFDQMPKIIQKPYMMLDPQKQNANFITAVWQYLFYFPLLVPISMIAKAIVYTASSGLRRHDAETRIDSKLTSLSMPVLAVHAKGDTYCNENTISSIIQKRGNNKDSLLTLTESRHAYNHLKQKQPYSKTLSAFITTIIHDNQSSAASNQIV